MTAFPSEWTTAPLGEIAPPVTAATISPKAGVKYELWSVPSFAMHAPEIVDGSTIGSSKRPVEEGDVLICKINPRINRVWKVGERTTSPQIASTEWIAVRPLDVGRVNADFLRHYLSSPNFRDWIVSEVSGVTGSHTRASPGQVLAQSIPVPPMREQLRITELLETHLSRIDVVEPALELIPRRAVSLEEAWLKANLGSPEQMETMSIGDVLHDVRGGWSRSRDHLVPAGRGHPYLKMNNITRRGRLDLGELVCVEANDEELDKYGLRPGDILFNSKNSGDLVGKTAVATKQVEGALINENIMRLRFDDCLIPPFVALWFLGPVMRRHVLDAASASTNVAAVYQKDLVRFPIWVPHKDEQQRLVKQFAELQQQAHRMSSAAVRVSKRAAVLRRTLLASAFAGHLAAG